VDVRSRETQQPESSVDKQVLPAIVFDQSVPVVAAVVLEDESRRGVVEVRPPDEAILAVIEIRLDLWPRQAVLQEKPAKSGLHRRFGRRRHRSEELQLSAPELFRGRQLHTQRRVHGDKNFHRR
jgi:hypothetical protein